MQERELAEKNKILEIVTGSHLYGTSMPTSDKDYVGVFLPDVEHVLGFKTVEEVDFSIVDKNEAGKNTPDALDRKLYEFRKFIKLAMDNNPNILEQLFVNTENTVFINDVGKELLAIKHLFPHKGLKQKFLGYAFAQKHKMIIKKDNYFDFISALDYLQKQDYGKTLLEIALDNKCPHFIEKTYAIKKHGNIDPPINFITIGDMNFMPAVIVKKARTMISERLEKVGNREELFTKYGFDVKFGMHLIRLMLEGVELLRTGEIKFPLKEASMLKEIREGKWGIDKILNFSYELEAEIESIVDSSKLPSKPNIEQLEEFAIKTLRKVICV